MNSSQISKRYAQALHELAIEQKSLEPVAKDMQALQSTCDQVAEFKYFLRNPIIKPALKIKVITAIFGDKFNDLSLRFVKLLIQKGRSDYMHEISREFISLHRKYLGFIDVELSSATKLDNEIIKEIEAKIASFTNLKPSITEKIDPKLIGGFAVKFENNVYDATVRKKIRKIYRDFQTNIYKKGF